jgi:hypothetical protein
MASVVPSRPTRSRPWKGQSLDARRWRRQLPLTCLLALGLVTSGCQGGGNEESRRLDRVELKIQQLEQRLNKLSVHSEDGADQAGKPPAGVIKSLTFRLGTEDDRLRIYWADGSRTDIPCTKEQATYVCG